MATKLFLRNTTTNGITNSGDGVVYDMITTAGSAVDTDTVTLTNGGTNIQWTQTAGGSSVAWISGRVPAGGFTLTTADISAWFLQSNMNDEAGGRLRIYKYTPGTPTITELTGSPFDDGVEFGTSITEMTWTANPTDTSFAENDRILIRIFATNITTMTAGTADLQFNAADATTGDSFFNIAETVSFKAEDPPPLSVSVLDYVFVIESGLGTMTANAISQDTFYGTSFLTGPNGSATDLHIGGFGDHYYPYLQFDLTGLPAQLATAKLVLSSTSANSTSPLPGIYRLTQSWSAATLSLSAGGSSDASTPTHDSTAYQFLPAYANVNGDKQVADLSVIANLWASGTSNFGIVMIDTVNSPNSDVQFAAVDNATAALRPILYTAPVVTVQIAANPTPSVSDTVTVTDVPTILIPTLFPSVSDKVYVETVLFGTDSVGTSQWGAAAGVEARVTKFTSPSTTGTIVGIEFYGNSDSGTITVGASLYSDNADVPNARLVGDTGNASVNTTAKWNFVPLEPYTFASSTKYWLGLFGSSGSTLRIYYVTGGTNQSNYATGLTFETWPDPWPAGTFQNRNFSLFARYYEGANFVTLGVVLNISVSDTVTVTEDVALSVINNISVSDTVTVSEDTVLSYSLPTPISDLVTVTENISLSIPLPVFVFDSVTVTEDFSGIVVTNISAFDEVAVTENIALSIPLPVSVDDLITVTDVPTLLIPILYIDVNDPVTVTENIALNINTGSEISELITVTENIQLQIVSFISVSDTVTVTEQVYVGIETGNRYWIGGTGTVSDNSHWSYTSGGAGFAAQPNSTTNVFIDTNSGFGSGGTLTWNNTGVSVKNFTSSVGAAYTIDMTGGVVNIYGSLALESGLAGVGDQTEFDFLGSASATITMNGCTSVGNLWFYETGTRTFQDDWVGTANSFFYLEGGGTVDANDNDLKANTFDIEGWSGEQPTFTMGSGTMWTKFWDNYSDVAFPATINSETSTIKLSNISGLSASPYFSARNVTYNNVWILENGTGGGVSFFDGFYESTAAATTVTFNDFKIDPAVKVSLNSRDTWVVSSFNGIGTVGNLITLTSHAQGVNSYDVTGGEEVTNGGFVGGTTGWTLGTNWTYDTNKIAHTAGTASNTTQANTLTQDAQYLVSFNVVSISAGAVGVGKGVDAQNHTYTTTGVKEYILTASAALYLQDIRVYGNSAFVGSVTDVSIKQVTLKKHTLSKASGTVNADFLDISNSNATGGALWYAGGQSLDTTNNSGWIFSIAPFIENVTVTENISLSIPLPVSVNDQITVTDVPALVVNTNLNVFDAVTATEDVALSVPLPVSVSDQITITDVPVVVVNTDISVSDTVTVTEDISLVVNAPEGSYTVSVFDNITVTEFIGYDPEEILVGEVVIVTILVTPSVFDAITVTEDVVVVVSAPGALTVSVFDEITVTENISLSIPLPVSVNDLITVTDVITLYIPILYIAVDDTVTVTENISLSIPLPVFVYEDVTVTENIVLVVGTDNSIFDLVTVTENITLSIPLPVSVSDLITVTDDVSLSIPLPVFVYEDVIVTDVPTIFIPILYISVIDTISVDEFFITSGQNAFSVFDAITVTEEVTLTIPILYISASDLVTVTESVQFNVVSYISVNELITVTESVQLEIVSHISVNDLVTVTEDVDVNYTLPSPLFEAVTITESVTLLIPILYLSVSEDVTVTEVFSTSGTLAVFVFDSVTVTEDSTQVIPTLHISVNDAVTVTEFVSVEVRVSIDVFETITVTENINVYIPTLPLLVFDLITVTEDVSISTGVNVFDAVTVSEDINLYIPVLYLSVSDLVTVTEDINISAISFVVFDVITVTEQVTVIIPTIYLVASEDVTITESTTAVPQTDNAIYELITVTESISFVIPVYISVFDGVTVTDSVTIDSGPDPALSETITVTENINFRLKKYGYDIKEHRPRGHLVDYVGRGSVDDPVGTTYGEGSGF